MIYISTERYISCVYDLSFRNGMILLEFYSVCFDKKSRQKKNKNQIQKLKGVNFLTKSLYVKVPLKPSE